MRRIAAALAGVAVLVSFVVDWPTESEASVAACNGDVRLCTRHLGDVAFATTHNSMASTANGFLPPNQRRSLRAQLAHGIRGLQIDAYLGTAHGSRVSTDLSTSLGDPAELPPVLVRTARRIHQRLGAAPPGTPDDAYLCHVFCELGAVRMVDELRVLREFLDSHPREVFVIVVEDHAPAERVLEAFRAAGLEQELLAFDPATPLPTLGEMIAAGTRLQVSLEQGSLPPTLPNTFTGVMEETPFTFLRPRALEASSSCEVNRGTTDAPMFQFNHWVTPAEPVTARRVNGPLLRERIARCMRVRGRTPTLVAVDFAEEGELRQVVAALNR